MTSVEESEALAGELFARFITPEARIDPYPVYDDIRRASPMLDTGVGLWLATGYATVRAILRDPKMSSDGTKSAFHEARLAVPEDERLLHPVDDLQLMLFMDQPDHTRLRRLVSRPFTPRRIAEIRPRVDAIVASLLDNVVANEPFDVISDLAYPLATQVICEMLGVPVADRERFGAWSSDMALGIDPSSIRSDDDNIKLARSTEAFVEYFADLIEARRCDLGDDILSALIVVEEQGDRLSHDELLATGMLLLIAGHETTVNLVGNAAAALIAQPEALHTFQTVNLDQLAAVDEMIRLDAPVQLSQRVALVDVEIDGHVVKKGETVVVLLGAANRDPSAFDEPASLRFDRPAVDHVGFGGGIHHCLGAALARVEAAVAITELFRRFGPCVVVGEPSRRTTFTLRGYRELRVQSRR